MGQQRRPACTGCGERTALARISPIESIHELRTFECVRCGQVDRYAVKADPRSYWVLLRDLSNPVESEALGAGCSGNAR
ncbi:hypothetical protein RPD_2509 [Rhodopseudomonas palustris BisB5]|uniref:Uncharacterized protein n=1 Tax=Rhodopseudomonas palustris (strain BisB5) TaxID=316057 RepID=Q137K0_RHOPS|nr:hypothetical protein RPD_2509 [Rhodopseudomonas palustris BisB5]